MSNEIQLKVSSTTVPARFAGSLVKNLMEGKVVTAKALGTHALYRMVKGIATAQNFVEQNEKDSSDPKKLVTMFNVENYESNGDDALVGFVARFELI